MNKKVTFFLFLLISFRMTCYALEEIPDNLAGLTREKYESNLHLLSDLPKLSLENLRLYLPAQNWLFHKKHIAKGSFVRVVSQYYSYEKKMKGYKGQLNFYEKSNLEGKPAFTFSGRSISVNDQEICYSTTGSSSVRSNDYFLCGSNYCLSKKDSSPVLIQNYLGLTDRLTEVGSQTEEGGKGCRYNLYYYNSSSRDYYDSIDLKISKLSNDKNFAEVLLDNKTFYLDLRFCKQDALSCKFLDLSLSEFEKAWLNLKFAQKHKNEDVLNYLIGNLLPCVKKKDKKCVQSFFVTEKEVFAKREEKFPAPVKHIDEKVFKDLETCLSYERLLPYGGRARAKDDRICIFFPDEDIEGGKKFKIQSITLPDAYKNESQEIAVDYSRVTGS